MVRNAMQKLGQKCYSIHRNWEHLYKARHSIFHFFFPCFVVIKALQGLVFTLTSAHYGSPHLPYYFGFHIFH
jgi:hypothetical protein